MPVKSNDEQTNLYFTDDNGKTYKLLEIGGKFEAWFDDTEDRLKDDDRCWNTVSHPKHYCRNSTIESIDEMVEVFGPEVVMNFCLCNVWKYRYRAAEKNGEEDIKKSDWYMRKYIELKEEL